MEDGEKREIRVTVMRDKVKWQFKRESEEQWDYNSPPSRSDWDELMQKVENRYHRRTASHANLILVRRLHREALGTV